MKIRHENAYDAPQADVLAMLTDPAFREKASLAQGCHSATATATPTTDGAVEMLLEMVQPTEGLPSIAKKFAGDKATVRQRETWRPDGTMTFRTETVGKPGTIDGQVRLDESGGTTTETVTGEVKVKVPLIGGKIEQMMADLFTEKMHQERAVGVTWLAGDR